MSDNIKVAIKIRPLISRELDENLSEQWKVCGNSLVPVVPASQNECSFVFGKSWRNLWKVDSIPFRIANFSTYSTIKTSIFKKNTF